jgi:hypothetical protein
MKLLICYSRAATVVLLSSILGVPRLVCGDTTVAMAAAPSAAPKSVFNSQPGSGKDPFFPKSTRLIPIPSVRVDPASLNSDFIVLTGLSIRNQRRLAIINNYTVEAGEEFTLKVNGRPFKVKCIEIKDNSVIINVNGSTKELQLRPGL